jgi:actin-related protein 5
VLTVFSLSQLHFAVEKIRGPELLFQPSMMGICEAGLAETIDYVLKLFPSDDQQRLVDNIFITGGIAKLPGLKERLLKELMEIRPFKSTFSVKIATDPSLNCWNGMKKFAACDSDVKTFSIDKQEYYEHGGEFIKEHCLSNRYFKSPMEKIDNSIM